MNVTSLPAELIERLGSGPILALTGAGVSAESGLATFRGPGGLWEGHDPLTLATPAAFRDDPATVWRFYRWRREQAARARPNAAHHALARIERARGDFLLVTQNVDGLHERAGSRRLLRLHGTLWRLRCCGGCGEIDDARTTFEPFPPACACGALLRPAVIWFGEALPAGALAEAEAAARAAAVVVVAGTSSLVYPAAALPRIARAAGAFVVEVNPEPTPLTDEVDLRIGASAGTALPAIAAAIGAEVEA